MAGAFAWLNRLIQSFGQLFPRIVLVRRTYALVKFRWNGSVAVRNGGLAWYWPIATDIRMVPITERAAKVSVGVVAVRNGPWEAPVCTSTSVAVMFSVTDVLAMLNLYDSAAVVENVVTAATRDHWPDEKRAAAEAREELVGHGIELSQFAVVNVKEYISHGEGHQHSDHRAWGVEGDQDAIRLPSSGAPY